MKKRYKILLIGLGLIVSCIAIWVALVALVTLTLADSVESAPIDREFTQEDTNELYALINQYRLSKGVAELNKNTRLESSARLKAGEIVVNNNFSHQLDGEDTIVKYTKESEYCNFRYNCYIGENLAKGYYNAENVMGAWEVSPKHNKNLLGIDFKDMGIAIACHVSVGDQNDTCIIVLHLGNEKYIK